MHCFGCLDLLDSCSCVCVVLVVCLFLSNCCLYASRSVLRNNDPPVLLLLISIYFLHTRKTMPCTGVMVQWQQKTRLSLSLLHTPDSWLVILFRKIRDKEKKEKNQMHVNKKGDGDDSPFSSLLLISGS